MENVLLEGVGGSLKLDPVGSTVRYEMMKLYWVSIGHYEAVAVGNS